jgi:XTP/dITP diphosphohydrolase
MANVTFITGSQNKADRLAEYLNHPVDHVKLELDEIQSLDPREVAAHKARQAYQQINKPVLVEDTFLIFTALGKLPGPLIKWFLAELGIQSTADLLKDKDRGAVAGAVFAYCDGERVEVITGMLKGTIAEKASGDGGWGWDKIFIPAGAKTTQASATKEAYEANYTKIKPFAELKAFLESL